MHAVVILLALGHGGEVHDTTRGCPGSIFAGAVHAEHFYVLDWMSQYVYLVDRLSPDEISSASVHQWRLPPSYWYAIAQHPSGALVVAENRTCIITPNTTELGWTPIGCAVHKLRLYAGAYYGLNILTGKIYAIPSCEVLISTPPPDYVPDSDGVRVWSFDVNASTVFVIGDNGRATVQMSTDNGSTWRALGFDAWSGHRPTGLITHHYGDIFWNDDRLLAVTGEVCLECDYAQEDGNPGKVVEVFPRPRILAAGLRHPFMNALVGNLLLIGDVGGGSYEELNVLDVRNNVPRNFMWPHYEGRYMFSRDAPYYGGVPKEPAFVLAHCDISTKFTAGAYVSIAAAPIIIFTIAYSVYKRRIVGTIFRLCVGVGVAAPVWYSGSYGHSYNEGILYAVEDGHVSSYNPTITKYIVWSALVAAIITRKYGGILSLPFVIWLLAENARFGPYSANLLFLTALFIAITLQIGHDVLQPSEKGYL